MGFPDWMKRLLGKVDQECEPDPEPEWEYEPEPEPEVAPEPVVVPDPIVLVAGPATGPTTPASSGFTDYYCRETGAHVQAVQRAGKFTIHTQDGEQNGLPGDYWVRPSVGFPRVVARDVFEARFRPHGGE